MAQGELVAIYSQHTVYLQRVAASLGNGVEPYLEVIERKITEIFAHYKDMGITPARKARIIEDINKVTTEQLALYTKELNASNREIGLNEAKFAGATLASVTDDAAKAAIPTMAHVSAAAISTPIKLAEGSYVTYKSMLKQYESRWADTVDAIVLEGFTSGQSMRDISKSVLDTVSMTKAGQSKSTFDQAKRSAKAMAQMGVNHYSNTARIAFAQDNKDIIKGYELVAVIDSRTSQKCRGLDGKIIKADDPKLSAFTPPLHRGCRTALVYEVDDKYKIPDAERNTNFEQGYEQKETGGLTGGKREAEKVSSEKTYYEAMKKLNAKDQDAILGPTLGKAFRKLNNPQEFAKATIDSLGNPLTIAEMVQKQNKLGNILRDLRKQ